MSTTPNLVIAGTVKGGTTSLFSYLAMHTDICPSKIKETCYFLPLRYGGELQPWDSYLQMFDSYNNQPYILEATPGYFEGGSRLAEGLKARLGNDVKIIITLRNPVERLLSFFRYKKAQLQLPKDMSMEAYLETCRNMTLPEKSLQKNDPFWGVEGGHYLKYLQQWFTVIPEKNIKIVFFDDLANNPKAVMRDLCEWLDIDPHVYENASFTTENKTVQYKNAWLQKLAIFFNQRLESILRRLPKLKLWIREIYYTLNGVDDSGLSAKEMAQVKALYQPEHAALRQFIKSKGYKALPLWLE